MTAPQSHQPPCWHCCHCWLLTPVQDASGGGESTPKAVRQQGPAKAPKRTRHDGRIYPQKEQDPSLTTWHCSHPEDRAILETVTKTSFWLVPRNSKLSSGIPPKHKFPFSNPMKKTYLTRKVRKWRSRKKASKILSELHLTTPCLQLWSAPRGAQSSL